MWFQQIKSIHLSLIKKTCWYDTMSLASMSLWLFSGWLEDIGSVVLLLSLSSFNKSPKPGGSQPNENYTTSSKAKISESTTTHNTSTSLESYTKIKCRVITTKIISANQNLATQANHYQLEKETTSRRERGWPLKIFPTLSQAPSTLPSPPGPKHQPLKTSNFANGFFSIKP